METKEQFIKARSNAGTVAEALDMIAEGATRGIVGVIHCPRCLEEDNTEIPMETPNGFQPGQAVLCETCGLVFARNEGAKARMVIYLEEREKREREEELKSAPRGGDPTEPVDL